ncbi:hypothetical protein ABKA04_009594 [Annulohypoxylon sp. FPYF3050]
MFAEFRGKGTYQAEFDIHFPTLTMRETLEFASKARKLPQDWNECHTAVETVARTLGLTKALDVKMGNALVPGVSGGERKRTSIAEILLGDSVFQCWDNSTRGLDSVNALDFIKTLRRRTSESGSVAIVTLYQAGEDIYDLFDKVTVIHEGRQVYFGPTRDAKKYFADLGFIAPPRSTTPEFLTSVTRPIGLRPQTREEDLWPPRTAAEFSQAWKNSPEYKVLVNQVDDYNQTHLVGGDSLRTMRRELKGTEKQRSPYILPVLKQIGLCVHRGFLRLRHNLAVPISTIMGNMNTSSFFGRTVLLFFTSLVNTTLAAFESVALWDDRPIIEKHVHGFAVPFREMRPWLQWFSYINPVYYVFEAMVVNEFHGREFDCATFVPEGNRDTSHFICSSAGATPGKTTISGDDYIRAEFGFEPEHLWRNLGIVIALGVFFAWTYVTATEYITMLPPRSDILLFQRGHMPSAPHIKDEEMGTFHRSSAENLVESKKTTDDMLGINNGAHLLWTDLSYSVKEDKDDKVILNNIDGWVKPGTLTALMGPSGAGKTTLLNVLAERTTIGVVTGNKTTNTRYQNVAFARKIGYAQQDDIHLPTTSVREALTFSALLRQPAHYSKHERIAYVDHVIELLNMEAFQHAVVGRLNVEQKKRVTIGVELAARPELLLFLDEPTSGLDSDSAWSFCTLLRQLADRGQAILCTIHQPSGPLLTLFDRLLFLKEGHSMYFGDFGPEFRTLIQYFESHGARKCLPHENPAEWMMEVTSDNATDNETNWAEIWTNSLEYAVIKDECQHMQQRLSMTTTKEDMSEDRATEFATSFWYQLGVVTERAFKHDWRSPEYLYSKALTTFGCAFINGVSFWASGYTSQDVQNQIFSLFLLTTIFGTHVQLIMERFYHSRLLYENRERQSRTYSWLAFLISNIVVELASQTVISVIAYVAWYYPVGFWRKAIDQGELNSRSGLVFLLIWSLLVLFQTVSQMLMTIMPNIPTGINNANLLFMLSLIFAGVLVPPDALPRFWIFMYRATPLSYYISAIISTGLSGSNITCSSNDILQLDPPPDQTCGSYLSAPSSVVLNPDDTAGCQVCPYTSADALLAYFGIYYEDRWWQYGVTIAYNVINILLAFLLYWLVMVPKGAKKEKKR